MKNLSKRFSMIASPDQRFCELCSKEATLIKPLHSCKRCTRNICLDCSQTTALILNYSDFKKHKICLSCEEDKDYQDLLREKGQAWATDSIIGLKWLTLPKVKQLMNENNYQEYLNLAEKQALDDPAVLRRIRQDTIEIESLNYSLYEFIYYSQRQIKSVTACQMNIENVIKAFCVKYTDYVYCSGMHYLVCFLLNFLTEEKAFWILCYLVDHVIPPNFFSTINDIPHFGFNVEKLAYTHWVTKDVVGESEKRRWGVFCDRYLPSIILSLVVDIFTVDQLLQVWDDMIMSETYDIISRSLFIALEHIQRKHSATESIDLNAINKFCCWKLSYETVKIMDDNYQAMLKELQSTEGQMRFQPEKTL